MKRIALIVILLFASFLIYSQAVTNTNIINDSAATATTRLQEFMDRVRMIQEAINQVKNTYDVLQAQLKAIESLGKGDLDGLSQAIMYEERTIDQFNDLINGFNYLKEIDAIDELLKSKDFNAFKVDVQCLDDAVQSEGTFLQQSVDLIKNTKKRIDAQKDIASLSKSTDSITGQLQLQSRSLGLLSNELQDILITSAALNNAILTEQKNEQIKKELHKKMVDQIYYDTNTDIFKSKYTDEELKDYFFNITE